jgi:hypothetical protein
MLATAFDLADGGGAGEGARMAVVDTPRFLVVGTKAMKNETWTNLAHLGYQRIDHELLQKKGAMGVVHGLVNVLVGGSPRAHM